MTLRWQQLQAKGATDAAINVVGDGGAVCTSELGVTTTGKSVATFVAEFARPGPGGARLGVRSPRASSRPLPTRSSLVSSAAP